MKLFSIKKTIFTTLIFSLFAAPVQAMSVGRLLRAEPRRIRVQRGVLPGVAVLDLRNMNIDNLDGLKNIPGIEKVTRFYLSNNNITRLKAGDLAPAVNLRVLGLSDNGLEAIEPNAFAGLKKLKVLNLANNNIVAIPKDGLNGIQDLRFLGMSANPMPNPRELQPQVPKALITVLPITRANLKKWGTWLGAGVAALIGTVAVGTSLVKEKGRRDVESGSAHRVTEEDIIALRKGRELWEAVMSGNPDRLQQFFGEGPDNTMQYIDLVFPSSNLTPLTLAIVNGNAAVVEKLLSLGADRALADKTGKRPMQYAAESPVTSIRELFGLGQRAMKRANLQDIIVSGNVSALEDFFRENAENINYINEVLPSSYLRPLTLAVIQGDSAVVEKLLALGADPELPDASGKTPIEYAQEMENQEIIDLLNEAIRLGKQE